jgi:hypothetical protein
MVSSTGQFLADEPGFSARRRTVNRADRARLFVSSAHREMGVLMSNATLDKTRENRLRAAVQRQGYQLIKSRRRDPRALDYGGYMIVNPHTSSIEAGDLTYGGMTLDQVEEWLADGEVTAGTTKAATLCEQYAGKLRDAGFEVQIKAHRSAYGTTARLVATKGIYQVSADWHTGAKPARTRFEGAWCGEHPERPNFQPRKAPSVGALDELLALDDLSEWKMVSGFNRGETA